MSLARVVLFLLIAQLPAATLEAAPVKVRLVEGNARGFLVLRTLEGEVIAHGELRQKPAAPFVESRLLLNFKDGSVFDEVVTFSQTGIFRLEAYRHRQRGPSLPTEEVTFDRRSGRYQARTQEKKGAEEKTAAGTPRHAGRPLQRDGADAPEEHSTRLQRDGADRRVPAEGPAHQDATLHGGEDRVVAGGDAKKATRYLMKLEIGGLSGVVASMMGKEPPDLRYWLIPGDVPAFARFEGAMFLNGPVWRLEMEVVEWPK